MFFLYIVLISLTLSAQNLNFKDLWDFSKKIDIKLGGKKSLEALSQSGAFDALAPSRSIAIASAVSYTHLTLPTKRIV